LILRISVIPNPPLPAHWLPTCRSPVCSPACRDEGRDILIVARTDSRQAQSLDEALWRAAAFADAGADIVFIDALETEGEMEALCRVPGAYKVGMV
jgi:2-methylisocitrate lyase-like PEP mutase family enzyme